MRQAGGAVSMFIKVLMFIILFYAFQTSLSASGVERAENG